MSSGPEAQPVARQPALRPLRRRASVLRALSPRQELWLALLLGALGAGLIFLATRQGWAQIRTIPPKPLPPSSVTVTGAGLVPYTDALVVAGLATLAAVLASRRLLRRLTGVLLAVIGAGLAASAFTLTQAGAVSAATSNVSPETAAAGSVMAGSGSVAASTPDVAGTAPHVVFVAAGWQAIVVIGAVAMVAAGLLVVLRAGRMAVMSSRYDSPTLAGHRQTAGSHAEAGSSGQAGPPAHTGAGAQAETGAGRPADSAAIWDSLSRGEDPTSAAYRPA